MKPFLFTIIQCSQVEHPTPEYLRERAWCEALCDAYDTLDDKAFYPFEADMSQYHKDFPLVSVAFDAAWAVCRHCEGRAYQEALEDWIDHERRYDADMNM